MTNAHPRYRTGLAAATTLALALATLAAGPASAALPLPALAEPSPADAADATNGTGLRLQVSPATVNLTSANDTARYRVDVWNNGTLNLTVDLTLHDVTPGWTAALNATTLHVGAGDHASTRATFRPPADAAPGDAGAFTVRAEAHEDPTAADEDTARAEIHQAPPPPQSVRHNHTVYGTRGVGPASIPADCSPQPGASCAAVPLHGSYRCDASSLLPAPGLALRVRFLGGNATGNTTTPPPNGTHVEGDVPNGAHAYVVEVHGAAVVTRVTCEFRAD